MFCYQKSEMIGLSRTVTDLQTHFLDQLHRFLILKGLLLEIMADSLFNVKRVWKVASKSKVDDRECNKVEL